MRAAKKTVNNTKVLQDLVPLNALSDDRFSELSEKIVIEVVKAGRFVFRAGDRDNRTAYLLEGRVSLIDSNRKVTGEVAAGSDASRHPLANHQPRQVSARVTEKAVVAWIDSGLLDVFLTWDQSNTADAVELEIEDTGDWMTRLLKSETFRQLPPSKLQGVLVRMKPVSLKKGDVVIAQGEEGDYFYTIDEGDCQVTRREDDGTEVTLAQLHAGDSFGEEALVSDIRRNATITMLTDGQLMRLAKEDFDGLLKTQHLKYIDYDKAVEMVDAGAVWLDVRTPDEYAGSSFEDSVNLPLADLRGELPELVFNSSYIICCDTGRRSDSAGFVLSHKGFDVYVLEGGMSSLPEPVLEIEADVVEKQEPDSAASDARMAVMDADIVTLQDQVARLSDSNATLARQLEERQKSASGLSLQVEQLKGELGDSTEKLGELYSRINAEKDEKQSLQDRLGKLQEEQQERLIELEQALSDVRDENSRLTQQVAAEAARVSAESGQSEADLQELAAEKQQLTGELVEVRGQLAAFETERQSTDEKLANQMAAAKTLQAENSSLNDRLSGMQSELSGLQAQLADAPDTGEAARQEQDGRLAALESELQRSADELAAVNATIDALRDENSTLADENATIRSRLDEQAGTDAISVEQLSTLQSEHATTLDELESVRRTEAQLQARIVQLEESQQARDSESGSELQAMAAKLEEADSAKAAAETDRDNLRQKYESETAGLREDILSGASDRDERIAELEAQLEAAQLHAVSVEEQLDEKRAEVESLAVAIDEKQAADDQSAEFQQQLDEALAALEKREELTRELETEFAVSLSKSHDELKRKNDTEKELQGQIDRLRKKLEQVSQDNQKSRESSLDDLDTLREELHLERQARAEERAQMAARQRELKEQLAAIGTQHEANITDQSGAIEEARDAAREEERSRMQSIIDSHAETEERLVCVQAELQQAHEEIAVLDQQEKARRQAEIDAVREQNEQAEAAITQLETQLRQLTRERDSALEDQHDLRVKMNTLRGEVEVARGLMTAGGKGRLEDPEQLRAELEETRKNVKIAVRLRAEAESARDRIAAELTQLRTNYALGAELAAESGESLHMPSLDLDEPAAAPTRTADLPPLIPESVLPVTPAGGVREFRPRGVHPVIKATIALMLIAVAGFAAWIMTVRSPEDTAVPVEEMALPGTGEHVPGGAPVVAERPPAATTGKEQTRQDSLSGDAARPDVTVAPTGPFAAPADTGRVSGLQGSAQADRADRNPASGFVGPQPLRTEASGARVPDARTREQVARPPLPDTSPVGKAYRDKLKGGGKGPSMMEIQPASFQMGSSGNSLNFDEGPRHAVSLDGYSISRREVTFSDYDRFARATGRRLPFDESWGRGKQPVINVSWHDALAYTQWLSKQTGKKYRLPSEAEWEYAARAGSGYSYWWADITSEKNANCFDCGSQWDGSRTAPTGSFEANRFGLYDMSGNVQEWTADCYHNSYIGAPADGRAWVDDGCTQRVVRGGAYSSPLDSLRSAKRGQLSQDTRLDNLGFRVVREK